MLDKRIYWLWLVQVFGVSNPRIWQLGERFSDIETYVRSIMNGSVRYLTDDERRSVKEHKISEAEELLNSCLDKGISVYCYESEGYPQKLKRISNPPSVLFCYGNLDFLDDRVCIAVVGTRKPSEYSVSVTEKLCRQLIERDILLASGFALGIDKIGNEVSLENNIPTVAVMGTAIDEDYPKGSKDLKMQIAQNGVVISEYCSYMKVPLNSFVQRNRILVGLSDGVLFCECSDKSRGLDNAKHAAVQGKPIFVIPPNDIFEPRYFGQRDLIRNGALTVFSGADIASNLAYESFEDIHGSKDYKLASDDSEEFELKPEKKSRRKLKKSKTQNEVQEVEAADTVEKDIDYSLLTETQKKICKALEGDNLIVDEIVFKTGEDVSIVLSELIELELKGIIKAFPGKIYGIVK
ncbi:MAG: DNA-protecting protein DprA [Ruminococcus sp.]|nr:DNA-protecting protein DprA [Ruminococcus sp.]